SGRPIYPIAIATRSRMELNNWDRTTINLPFGSGGRVADEPIPVAPNADASMLEAARQAPEGSLHAATARGYAVVHRPRGECGGAWGTPARARALPLVSGGRAPVRAGAHPPPPQARQGASRPARRALR